MSNVLHDSEPNEGQRPTEGQPGALVSPPRRSLPRRVFVGLLKLVGGLLGVVLALLMTVILLLAYPPTDLLRRAAVPLAREALKHPAFDLGGLKIELGRRGRIELTDLWLGPPRGYRLPLFSVRRIVIAYDASQALDGRIVVEQVQVERPVVRVESVAGKLNWLAFLDGLPKSKSPPKPPPKKTPSTGPPPKLTLELSRLAVIGLGAYVDDGKHRLVLDALDVAVTGRYVLPAGEGSAELVVALGAPAGRNSLAVAVQEPEAVRAYLDGRLKLRVSVDRINPPAGRVDLDFGLRSHKLESRWALPPLDFGLQLAAAADQRSDRGQVERVSLRFAGEELLKLHAALQGLDPKRGQLALVLERLHLPLDKLATYARPFVPGVRFGGEVDVTNVKLRSPLAGLGKGLPTEVSGRIDLRGLWADLARLPSAKRVAKHKAATKGPPKGVAAQPSPKGVSAKPSLPKVVEAPRSGRAAVRLRKLSATLLFAAGDAPGAERPKAPALLAALPSLRADTLKLDARRGPSALAVLRLSVGQLSASGAQLSGLALRLAGGANLRGLKPAEVAARVALDLGRASTVDPKLGPLSVGLQTRLALHGDLVQRDVSLEQLLLNVDKGLLRLEGKASASDFGKRSFTARFKLAPLSLARVLARLPGPIRRKLPLAQLKGQVGLTLSASGRTPAPRTPPMRLPVKLDAQLTLDGISATMRGKQRGVKGASVEGIGGKLRLVGRPSDLKISADLKLGGALEPALGVRVGRVTLPLKARLRRSGLEASFGLRVSRFRQRQLGKTIEQRDVAFDGQLKAALPVERLLANKPLVLGATQLGAKLRLGSVSLITPQAQASLKGVSLGFDLDHLPGRATPNLLRVRAAVLSLSERRAAARVEGLSLSLDAGLTRGLSLRLPPKRPVDLRELSAEVKLGLQVGRVHARGMPRELRRVALTFDAGLDRNGPLRLRKLALVVPDYGAKVGLHGQVWELRRLVEHPELMARLGLPEFKLQLDAGLASKKQLTLLPGISSRGSTGLRLELSRRGKFAIRAKGRLLAKHFNLQQQTVDSRREGGQLRRYQRTLRVKDFNADVPIEQVVELALGRRGKPPWRLPAPRRSIFAGASLGATYRTMRPFDAQRGNLSLASVAVEDQLEQWAKDGSKTKSVSTLNIGQTVLDLGIGDSTLKLNQIYMSLFGGDFFGSIQLQVPDGNPERARLRVDARLTSVDMAYLDAEARKAGKTAKVSALIGLKTYWSKRDVSGRIMLTDISMKTLDSMLAFLDPHKLDASMQANRKLLQAWYTRLVNPEVENVAVWIDHNKLNLDIRLGALWPFGALLRRVLKDLRIRRVSITPFLPKVKKKERKHVPRRRGARRRRGDWRLP